MSINIMVSFKLITILILSNNIFKCDSNNNSEVAIETIKNFRKKVEHYEINVEDSNKWNNEDSINSLLSILVKNANEIFLDSEEPSTFLQPSHSIINNMETNNESANYKGKQRIPSLNEQNNPKIPNEAIDKDVKILSSNKPLALKTPMEQDDLIYPTRISNKSSKTHLFENLRHKANTKDFNFANVANKKPFLRYKNSRFSRHTCISCTNLESIECNFPNNKLVSSKICHGDEDICYSQHTPFGIVERGCFNINQNKSTYVCSCNLCNYISISEMPHIFSTKRDWIENVIELSHTKNFRTSIFKDMSCLRCEVNASNTEKLINISNCLEGNFAELTIQVCAENEICGVKAIRSEGYIWRGCLSSPLYNYWWVFCDNDLCNNDHLESIYNETF